MKRLWPKVGRVAFWVSWPLLFFYLRIGKRTRVLVICEDKIVVTRGWLGTGQWALPGGGIHHGETAIDGAIREVYEETGLKLVADQLKPLGSDTAAKYGLKFVYEQFLVELKQLEPLKPQRFEILETKWIPILELSSNNAEEVTLKALAKWQQQR